MLPPQINRLLNRHLSHRAAAPTFTPAAQPNLKFQTPNPKQTAGHQISKSAPFPLSPCVFSLFVSDFEFGI
jgi:hypothetical protein